MKLKALQISEFRNMGEMYLVPHEGLTVISGSNGQGKTNLLESIFLLTGSKSFRGAKDAELIRRGSEVARVVGSTDNGQRESSIAIVVENGAKKGRFARVNQVDYGRAAAIAGLFMAVVFEPNHLSLVKAGPEGRRQFLDAALCQLYPNYIGILRRFARALAQKNAILRRYHEIRDAKAQLDVFDMELAQSGGEIMRRRALWLEAAGAAAMQYYEELAGKGEPLEIKYRQSAKQGQLYHALQEAQSRDIRAGFSTMGPQREDIEISLCGHSARVFASQGQQRSCVLALKLAEAEVARQITGHQPVLLLDDVLSELDQSRQAYLLQKMGQRQCFVSCCEHAALKKTAGKIVVMNSGTICDN